MQQKTLDEWFTWLDSRPGKYSRGVLLGSVRTGATWKEAISPLWKTCEMYRAANPTLAYWTMPTEPNGASGFTCFQDSTVDADGITTEASWTTMTRIPPKAVWEWMGADYNSVEVMVEIARNASSFPDFRRKLRAAVVAGAEGAVADMPESPEHQEGLF